MTRNSNQLSVISTIWRAVLCALLFFVHTSAQSQENTNCDWDDVTPYYEFKDYMVDCGDNIRDRGLGYGLGISAILPSSEKLSPAGGIQGHFDFFPKGIYIGVEGNVCFGSCTKNFDAKYGPFQNGNTVFNGNIMFDLGIQTIHNQRWHLYPYVGSGFSSLEVFGDAAAEPGTNRYPRKDAIIMGTGLKADFFLNRFDKWNNQNYLCIKPFISVAPYGHDLGYLPSFHLSVSFCWSGADLYNKAYYKK